MVQNLGCGYLNEKKYLEKISFCVKDGEVLTIIGPNGAGKSTLGYCLSGIIPHLKKGKISGNIILHNRDLLTMKLEEIKKRTGYVFQNPENQLTTLCVYNELGITSKNYQEAERLINLFNLQKLLEKSPANLSMGEKQKVVLISILLRKPNLVILDEPDAFLDSEGINNLTRAIEEIKKNSVVVVFTHNITFAKKISNSILGLRDGRTRFHVDTGRLKDADIEELYDLRSLDHDGWIEKVNQIIQPRLSFVGDNLFYFYDRKNRNIIKNMNFVFNSSLGIIGDNGSGKSTLLLLLAGLIKPKKGNVFLNKERVYKIQANQKTSLCPSIIFQNPDNQIFSETIYDELVFGLKNNKLPVETINKRINDICGLLNINEVNRDPHTLSYGWKKIISFACAIALDRNVIIIDEGEAALDLYFKKRIQQITQKLKTSGKMIISVTHNMDSLKNVAETIMHLNNGQIDWQLPASEVFKNI